MENLWEKTHYLSRKIYYRFQAEIYAILACAYEIQKYARPEQYISIFSDIRAVVKAPQTAKTTPPLVQQCQKALNDISTQYSVGIFWISVYSWVRGNEIADGLAREGIVHYFVGPKSALGVSRQNTRKKIKRWIYNQHMEMWWDLSSRPNQRQARELTSDPSPTEKTKLETT